MLATFFGWWFDFYSVQNSHKERHFIIIELQRKYLGFIYYLVVGAYYNPSKPYRGALSIVRWIYYVPIVLFRPEFDIMQAYKRQKMR